MTTTYTRSFFCFFYCDSTPRDLHSFPTRRSSDLEKGTIPASSQASPTSGMRDTTSPHLGHFTFTSSTHGLKSATPGDRKSTRLNSSHRCISYAVFCLKKKKIQIK